eukprot:GHRQ01032124.1.p2 GENE.GHRQ01032124.1~~GHRQ01032124.1.p2  ORF type:complete len:116 (+),score=11.07 GHRQ01032124.1:759-1106(+)
MYGMLHADISRSRSFIGSKSCMKSRRSSKTSTPVADASAISCKKASMLGAVILVQIRHFSAVEASSGATCTSGAAARAITVRGCCRDRRQAVEATPAAVKQGPQGAGVTRERDAV